MIDQKSRFILALRGSAAMPRRPVCWLSHVTTLLLSSFYGLHHVGIYVSNKGLGPSNNNINIMYI